MVDPIVPVSWGELLDKIAILDIKLLRLHAPSAVANAERELAALRPALTALEPAPPGLAELRTALAAVNERLWTIEDRIREKEAAGDFGPGFVSLARSVYRENDERGRIKRAINTLLGSRLVEEKQVQRVLTIRNRAMHGVVGGDRNPRCEPFPRNADHIGGPAGENHPFPPILLAGRSTFRRMFSLPPLTLPGLANRRSTRRCSLPL